MKQNAENQTLESVGMNLKFHFKSSLKRNCEENEPNLWMEQHPLIKSYNSGLVQINTFWTWSYIERKFENQIPSNKWHNPIDMHMQVNASNKIQLK